MRKSFCCLVINFRPFFLGLFVDSSAIISNLLPTHWKYEAFFLYLHRRKKYQKNCEQRATKGQLFSESIYEVIVSPKIGTKNYSLHRAQFFVRILGETMTSLINSEINWPLLIELLFGHSNPVEHEYEHFLWRMIWKRALLTTANPCT